MFLASRRSFVLIVCVVFFPTVACFTVLRCAQLIILGFSGRVYTEKDLLSECQTSRQQRAQQKSVVEPPNRPLRPPLAKNLVNRSLNEAEVDPRARNRRKRKRQHLNPQAQSDLADVQRVQ